MTAAAVDVPVFLLVALLGTSSWIAITGVFAELPLIIDALPEGWAVGSALSLVIQLANVAPVAFFVAARVRGRAPLGAAMAAVVALGTLAMALLAATWRPPAGARHSTALIALTFMAALADCLSTVTYYPFVARFPPVCGPGNRPGNDPLAC
jgi:hypothetical protein